jgi:hypothetical protein
MRTATGLTLIALGAILTFAIAGHPPWLNIQTAGWVIMLTGITGMLLPRRSYGWLRRRMILRRRPAGRAGQAHHRTYRVLRPDSPAAATGSADPAIGEPAMTARQPAEEVVEEYVQE